MARTLTLRQEAFLAAYLGESRGNGTDAARRAGYAKPRQEAVDILSNPVIAAAIEQRRAEIRAEGIAVREERIRAQNERWLLLQRVIADRAESYRDDKEPGRSTGLVVKTVKAAGGMMLEEYAVDTGLLAELRALEQHTAKELGQWVEKAAATSPDGEREHGTDLAGALGQLAAFAAAAGAAFLSGDADPAPAPGADR